MYKKTITYEDYNGNSRTEDFYFNITSAEFHKMQLETAGGLKEKLETIMQKQNGHDVVEAIDYFILSSYGEKTPDGKRFVKSTELSDAFKQTDAYNRLWLELCYNAEEASNFINGIFPKDIEKDIALAKGPETKSVPASVLSE